MAFVDAASLLRTARRRARLSLRALAAAAGTSHATLSAYESGRKVPTVDTLERVLVAAGWTPTVHLAPALPAGERERRGAELAAVLELAEQFPARHARRLTAPVFGR